MTPAFSLAFLTLAGCLSLGPDAGHSFSQKYDRIGNTSGLELSFGVVRRDASNELEMGLIQFYSGEGRSKPSGYPRFHLVNNGKDGWRYLKYRAATILVDGERFRFDPDHDGEVETGYILEFLWLDLTRSQFLKLARADSIEFKVGGDDFALGRAQLDAIGEFAALVADPSRKLVHPEAGRWLEEARRYDSKYIDDVAIRSYRRIVEEAGGTAEAEEAAKALALLEDPARKPIRKQLREKREEDEMVAAAAADAASSAAAIAARREREAVADAKQARDRALTLLRSARNLERARKRAGALDFYRRILKDYPATDEAREAEDRIKAMGPDR